MEWDKLEEILNTMDLPKGRITKDKQNVLWMIRNVGIRNRNHKDFNVALKALIDLNKAIGF